MSLIWETSNKKSKDQEAIEKAKRDGHWHLQLSGYGLSYFDGLVIEYRTIPPRSTLDDPWSRAHISAQAALRAVTTTCETARKSAEDARVVASSNPKDDSLKAATITQEQLYEDAKLNLGKVLETAALAQGAVESKLAAALIIEGLIQKRRMVAGDPLIWSNILDFEAACLRMLCFDPLKIRLLSLRKEYLEVMGETAAKAMAANQLNLQEMKEADFLRVQAEAANLLSELRWHYLSAPRLEGLKTSMSLSLGLYTFFVCALIFLGSPWFVASDIEELVEVKSGMQSLGLLGYLCHSSSTFSLVMIAGALGACLSAFQRIQNGGRTGAGLLNLRETPWKSLSVGVAPVIGAVSAFLLTMIFAGGIISGNLFPKITLRAHLGHTNAPAENTYTQVIMKNSALSATGSSTNNSIPLGGTGPATSTIFVTNHVTITNLLSLTNLVTLTNSSNDSLTWRDSKPFFQHHWYVASGADLALLLIWAFIAGFSERLVPDMLSRLAKKAEEKV